MGTVASTNAGLTDVLQTLSSAGSPLTSTLSTAALQSALQNASPSDIVKLSDAALKLETTDEMFGISTTSTPTNLLSELQSSTPPSAAAALSTLQEQQTAALFGDNSGSTPNSLFNIVG